MELGVGSAISKTFGFISVARYSPKGGVGGPQAFKKNVFSKGNLQDLCYCESVFTTKFCFETTVQHFRIKD